MGTMSAKKNLNQQFVAAESIEPSEKSWGDECDKIEEHRERLREAEKSAKPKLLDTSALIHRKAATRSQ